MKVGRYKVKKSGRPLGYKKSVDQMVKEMTSKLKNGMKGRKIT